MDTKVDADISQFLGKYQVWLIYMRLHIPSTPSVVICGQLWWINSLFSILYNRGLSLSFFYILSRFIMDCLTHRYRIK